jgi:hypothetical protein
MNPWIREDAKRKQTISDEEFQIRWDLAFGKITQKEFDKKYPKVKDLPAPRRRCGT